MGRISKFFTDNRVSFSNPSGTPEEIEKCNLYGGLAEMAEAIEAIESKLKQLEVKLNYLQANM